MHDNHDNRRDFLILDRRGAGTAKLKALAADRSPSFRVQRLAKSKSKLTKSAYCSIWISVQWPALDNISKSCRRFRSESTSQGRFACEAVGIFFGPAFYTVTRQDSP